MLIVLLIHAYHSTGSPPLWRHTNTTQPRTGVDYLQCMHAEYSLSTRPMKYTAIFDRAQSRHVDLFALTETCITSSATSAELRSATPPGFSLVSCPRPAPSNPISHIVGGDTAILVREPTPIVNKPSNQKVKSLEMSSLPLKMRTCELTVFNVYRRPQHEISRVCSVLSLSC